MYITKEEKERNVPIPYRDSGHMSLLKSDALYKVYIYIHSSQLFIYILFFNLLIVKLTCVVHAVYT
jgi:hypothetical protein